MIIQPKITHQHIQFEDIKKLSDDECNSIFQIFSDSYLTNKFHYTELYIYYINFITNDSIDKDSFILASTVLI